MTLIHEDKKDKKLYQRFVQYFTLTMLLAFILILGILLINRKQRINEYQIQSETQVRYLGEIIKGHFQSVKSDLMFLPELNELIRYKDIKNEKDRNFIGLEFLTFSRTKGIYDQIRYIGKSGKEEIRINYNAGSPYIVEEAYLQNKKDRYYFYESFDLPDGDIYVSPLDLNKEQGQIEQPLKPIIRFGTPVTNSSGEKTGVLILNYLAGEFLYELELSNRNSPGTIALVNKEGFWLYKDESDKEWGFMYPERSGYSFQSENPELWDKIISSSFSQTIDDGNIYTFLELQPLKDTSGVVNSPKWYLINWICSDDLGISKQRIIRKLLIYNLLAALLFGMLTLLLTKAVDQRNKFRDALTHSALHDSLTDLPNRELLKLRTEHLIEELKRFDQNFALLFLDLDSFKAVNDTHGHESGDELLIQVAERLKKSVRGTDTVARVGGDEFVILMTHLDNREQCSVVALKVLEAMEKEFTLTTGPAHIGASIGVALSETETGAAPDMNSMMKRADNAMYNVKKSGKGNFLID